MRYYDQIGLLSPSRRSPVGHRRYGDTDVQRLHRICLLRRAGLPLAEIGEALDEPDWDLHHAMLTRLDLLDRQQASGAVLRRRLTTMTNTAGRRRRRDPASAHRPALRVPRVQRLRSRGRPLVVHETAGTALKPTIRARQPSSVGPEPSSSASRRSASEEHASEVGPCLERMTAIGPAYSAWEHHPATRPGR